MGRRKEIGFGGEKGLTNSISKSGIEESQARKAPRGERGVSRMAKSGGEGQSEVQERFCMKERARIEMGTVLKVLKEKKGKRNV